MDYTALLTKKFSATLVGFGRSNMALALWLSSRGIRTTVCEAQPFSALGETAKELALRGVRFCCGEGYLDALAGDFLFISPGIRPDLPPLQKAVAGGARLASETSLFSALCPARLLGVTGSDGKTTTVTLASLLLEADGKHAPVGGNIGRPLISLLDGLQSSDTVIAELSSFQLMTEMKPPVRAAVTNLTENHLNWHRGMEEYIKAKRRIIGEHTEAILSADSEVPAGFARELPCPTLFSLYRSHKELQADFSNCHTITLHMGDICIDGAGIGKVSDILLPGQHNIANYMAALGLVYPYLTDIRRAFSAVARNFRGVPHRLEFVAEVGGVRYYNSSIDSTPTRTAATVKALGGHPILLCGGADKGLSFAPLREALEGRAKALVLFGATREKIAAAFSDSQLKTEIRVTMEEAVAEAMRVALPGDTVLLSPACTSFDEFRDFEERGEHFRRLVYEKQRRILK